MAAYRIISILASLIMVMNVQAQSVPTGGEVVLSPSLINELLSLRKQGTKSVDPVTSTEKNIKQRYPHLSELDYMVTEIMKQTIKSCFHHSNINNIFDITTMVEFGRMMKKLKISYETNTPSCLTEKQNEDCLIVKSFISQELIRLFITDSQVETYLAKKYPKDKAEIKNLLLFLKKASG